MNWKDVSRYSQRDVERIPSAFLVEAGKVDILIHRHIHYPGWLLTSRYLGIEKHSLSPEDLESAKKEALLHIYGVIHEKQKELAAAQEMIAIGIHE